MAMGTKRNQIPHDKLKLVSDDADMKPKYGNRFSLGVCTVCLSILLTTIFTLYGCNYFYSSADDAVIVVGSTQLDSDTLKKEARFISSELAIPFQGESRVKEKLIERVIDHYLVLEFGKKNGILISQREFEENLREIKEPYSEETFKEALLEGYISEEQWELRFRESLLVRKICAEFMEKVPSPSHEETELFFEKNLDRFGGREEVRFLQIVTQTEEDAIDLRGRIQRGEDFMNLARKYSITPEAQQGGCVDWIDREHLDPDLQEAFSSLTPGQLGPVIKTPFGYHVVRLLDTRTTDKERLEDVYPEVKAVLTQNRRNRFYANWLKELRSQFPVRVNQELLKQVEFS